MKTDDRERLMKLREQLAHARTRDDLVAVARAFHALFPNEDPWDAVGMVAVNVLRVSPPTRDEIEGPTCRELLAHLLRTYRGFLAMKPESPTA